ncbi:hypothetical protein AB0B85_23365 [Micromonospora sp. NPDC049044]|uniref:hypothetical protein n=1 Tax=unclassified Micromonospora TaxID=2617518 RepID=UPI0033EDCC60
MPARRNPKKSRTPRATPLGIDPAAERGPHPPTRPDLAVEPIEPALPAAAVPDALALPVDVPAAVDNALALPVDVPVAVDAPPVEGLPKTAGRPPAPTAGPPQGGGNRSGGGGRGQQAGQTRRYAFRRS